MRAVFVLAGLGAGGAERVVSLITRDWVDRGCAVTVVAFDHPGDPVYHRFDPRVRLVRLGLPVARPSKLRMAVAHGRRMLALRRVLRAAGPAVVVSFLTKINVLTLLASVGLRVPVIVSERNNPRVQTANPMWNRLLAVLYHRAAAVVLQTEASRACLPDTIRGRAQVIPNPIVAPAAVRRPPANHVLAAVGRLEPQKGFDLLLDAFALVSADYPDWQLVIWGDGIARDALEGRCRTLGLGGRVDLPGVSAVPGDWTRRASAFVLTSRFEGFPNVLGEAMATGLAVAAFDCEFGPREMIAHDVDGLLVRNGDVPELAAALRRLMHDEALRVRLGSAARVNIQRFCAEKVLGRWQSLASGLAGRA